MREWWARVETANGHEMELDSEGVYHFYNVLSADGTLTQLPTALDAGEHVSAVEEDAVNWRVHTNLTEILVFCLWRWGRRKEGEGRESDRGRRKGEKVMMKKERGKTKLEGQRERKHGEFSMLTWVSLCCDSSFYFCKGRRKQQ